MASTDKDALIMELLVALRLAVKQMHDIEDSMLGQGLQIIGRHLNGNSEAVDRFFADNDSGAVEIAETAIANAEKKLAE